MLSILHRPADAPRTETPTPMRILHVSQCFPPEMGASAARASELTARWSRAGHDVTVLTGFPHYPTGRLREEDRGKLLRQEIHDGVNVIRSWVYATANEGFAKRVAGYLSFAASAASYGHFSAPKCDVVIGSSPHFFCALAAHVIAKFRGVPFVFEVRDLWPRSIVEVGAMRGDHPAIRALEALEMYLYRQAARIITVTHSTREGLIARGIDGGKIGVVTNGVDVDRFVPGPRSNTIRVRHGLGDAFVVSYIGTIGMAHGLKTLLDVAAELPAVKFLIVGEGAERAALQAEAGRRGITNAIFTGERPREEVPDYIRASDASLVLLKRTPLFKTVIPSKLFEVWGCARPVVLGVEGETQSIVENARGGICVTPESVEEIVDAIRTLEADRELCAKLGENGRDVAVSRYSRDALAMRYVDELSIAAGVEPLGAAARRLEDEAVSGRRAAGRRAP